MTDNANPPSHPPTVPLTPPAATTAAIAATAVTGVTSPVHAPHTPHAATPAQAAPRAAAPEPLASGVHANEEVSIERPASTTSPVPDQTTASDDSHPGPGRAYMDKPVFTPYPREQQNRDTEGEMLFMPGDTFQNNQEFYEENANRGRKRIVTSKDIEYADVLGYGQMAGHDDEYDKALNRPGADWRSSLVTPNGNLRAGRPKLSDSHAKILSGDKAVARVRMLAGLGSSFAIPLWHTGIWVNMEAPSKDALINLHYLIQMEKIRLGRKTMGLVFSNETIYRTSAALRLALDCVTETTLANGLDLREHLSHHDIPLLIWAMACLCYPRGFEYSRPVRSADESKRVVVKGIVDVSKMCIVDNSYLTEWQNKHMSKRFGAVSSAADMTRYQEEFTIKQARFELIPDKLWMTLKIPSALESINNGQRWVDSIETLVKRTLQIDATDAQRNRLIATHATSTTMRQFTQWVATIEDDSHTYEETETIEKMLDDLSEIPDVRDRYIDAINTFINSTSASIIACPVVDVDEANFVTPTYPKYPYQIPIDPSVVFFQLLAQRIGILEAVTNILEQANS
jgi:hypothetical protein